MLSKTQTSKGCAGVCANSCANRCAPYQKRNVFMIFMYILFGVTTALRDPPVTEIFVDVVFVGSMVLALGHALWTGNQFPLQCVTAIAGAARVVTRDTSLALCPPRGELLFERCSMNVTDPQVHIVATSIFRANGLKTLLVALVFGF